MKSVLCVFPGCVNWFVDGEHVTYSVTSWDTGGVLTYTCEDGYTYYSGPMQRTCKWFWAHYWEPSTGDKAICKCKYF